MFFTKIINLKVILVFSFTKSIIHKTKFKNVEVIQSYLAHNGPSFLIPSITCPGKAATIIGMTSTKGTTWNVGRRSMNPIYFFYGYLLFLIVVTFSSWCLFYGGVTKKMLITVHCPADPKLRKQILKKRPGGKLRRPMQRIK